MRNLFVPNLDIIQKYLIIFSNWIEFLCLFWLWSPANCLQGTFSAHRLCHSGSVLRKSALRPQVTTWTTWSQLMMVMHHRWGGSLKGPDYHNHCDAIDLCDRLANCLFLPNVFIHAVMINAKKRSCLVICLGRPIALGATFYAPCLVICCPTCADLIYDTYDVQET